MSALNLLRDLIAFPSFSREEDRTAARLELFFKEKNIPTQRQGNNIWAQNRHFSPEKPTLLLNSHHDTVRPNPGYTRDPFSPDIADGKLFGLGSNDAGGCLVCLAAAFCHFFENENLPCNLVFAATAEEEISGKNGIESILDWLPKLDFAIVGEPTKLELAVAEKGLMVLDCRAVGQAGHAAREEGTNAIYAALPDIEWFRTYRFPEISPWLGAVKMSVTSIETPNKAHNMVPDECLFVVDLRLTELVSPEKMLEIISKNVRCKVMPRSLRIRPTAISVEHPLVLAGIALGKKPFGSPTTSDKALLPCPALKCGPGDSARSHTADEFIFLEEILDGEIFYKRLIDKCFEKLKSNPELCFGILNCPERSSGIHI